jgi:putative DNA primase/helicase
MATDTHELIPRSMRDEPVWLVWRYENGKKPPFDVRTGKKMDSNDAACFAPFEMVAIADLYDGIGYGLNGQEGRVAIDLDDCRDKTTGALTPFAEQVVRELNSYTEVSPSGTGLKIFVEYFTPSPSRKKPGLEFLTSNYSTVTGRHLPGTPTTVEMHAVEVATLLEREFGITNDAGASTKKSEPLPGMVVENSRNNILFAEGCKLRRLGWEEREIADALAGVNRHRCVPKLDADEIESIARSCIRYEPAADTFPLTETGDAEFFASCFSDVVRFDHRRGRWLLFVDHHWTPQTNGEVQRLALQAIRARQTAAAKIRDDGKRVAYLKWTSSGESRRRQTNLLAQAQVTLPIADAGDQWDSDPWLLGVQNGVVDLRTGTRRDGRPEDRITMRVRARFDANAVCPLYDKTVREIFNGDAALIDYIDRWLGYSATGDCREEAFTLCWGDGANGKGTLMNLIGWLLGDYADDLPFSALELHDHAGIPNDIAKIVGKRFITSSETGDTKRLNEVRVKALTGRDPITARFLHHEFFTFQPVAKFWLATNHRPIVRDTSTGFWRRIKTIPFTQSFAERPNLTLKDDLRLEADGILARLVRGCLAWQDHGLRDEPDSVRLATAAYRESSQPLTRFFDDYCVLGPTASATFGDLFGAYQRWAFDTRERSPLSRPTFGDELRKRFERLDTSKRNVRYRGIRLATADDAPGNAVEAPLLEIAQ